MRAEELRELSDSELDEKLEEFKSDLFNLRFELATGQLDNYKQLRVTRRDIARVMTVQRERLSKAAASTAEETN
ncbi:LSU ribosomal protein L29p (L35e) [Euzebya pacifica]|jgi:large subunit ribosomal protein L29|uniref:Large ribosomal subunit protein uL29 n=1 Tax=Euzebya pacifica TaxID=1608957 RepID=A0A346Y3U5_9ACTN|nr:MULTISPECIES: 50S ribosomal protein L29 [Euzebya]AXV09142.1 LSU ribosomal protein L29p (L35e) [Euzebya pacifica]